MGIDYCSRQSTNVDRSFIIDTLVRKAKKAGIKELTKSRQLKRLGFLVEIQYPRWFQGAKYALSNSRWPNYQYSNYHCRNKYIENALCSHWISGNFFIYFMLLKIFLKFRIGGYTEANFDYMRKKCLVKTCQWVLFYNLITGIKNLFSYFKNFRENIIVRFDPWNESEVFIGSYF